MGSLSSRQALLNPEFIDDGEDALYITFDDGDTGKYVRERACRYEPEEFAFRIDEEGNEIDDVYEPSEDCSAFVCSECGGSMLYGYDMGWFDDKPPYKPYFSFCPYCGSRVEGGELVPSVRAGESDGEIDRDALLKLADEFDAMAEAGIAAVFYRGDLFGCADRIREAVGA